MAHASDQWHDWSVETLSAVRGPLHTTEIVLGEARLRALGSERRLRHLRKTWLLRVETPA
jgi:hypothetical protein